MDQKIFSAIGVSPNEAKIYLTLVERGESTVSDIAVGAKIHRRNAYDAIQRLIDKGLCFQIFSSKENRYNAVDPDKLMELYMEKRGALEHAVAELTKKFEKRTAQEEVYIYRGLEGQKNIWRDVLRVGKESFFIGAKGAWYDPRLEASRIAFFKEANRKKIQFTQLFDAEVETQLPAFPKHFSGALRFRLLPKEYSTTSAIHTFGDYVVTNTGLRVGGMDEHTVFFVIQSADLAKSYRTWFWYMWEQSIEHEPKKK